MKKFPVRQKPWSSFIYLPGEAISVNLSFRDLLSSDSEFEMFGKTPREKYRSGLAGKYECSGESGAAFKALDL